MKGKQEYSPEFREEAVKLVTEPGLTPDEAARRLTIPKGTWSTGWLQPEGRAPTRLRAVARWWNWNRRTTGCAKNGRMPGWSATS